MRGETSKKKKKTTTTKQTNKEDTRVSPVDFFKLKFFHLND